MAALTTRAIFLHHVAIPLGILQLLRHACLTHRYLTHQLGFNDSRAISLFNAYASLFTLLFLAAGLPTRHLTTRSSGYHQRLIDSSGSCGVGLESDSTLVCCTALVVLSAATACLNQPAVRWANFTPLMTTSATGILAALPPPEYWIQPARRSP